MASVLMVCSKVDHWIDQPFDKIIGVDKGALACALKNIFMDLAIGDFDSITSEQLELVKKFAKEVVILNPIKDQTDAQVALTYTQDEDDVIMIGGLGHRLDHQYVNIQLMMQYPRLQLVDQNNHLMIVNELKVLKKEIYPYVSIFATKPSIVSFKGVKYPLEKTALLPTDLFGVSNEIVEEQAILTCIKGQLLVILSKD